MLDASGSISSSNAVDDVRDAADAFLDALRNTSSNARVTQFGSASQQLAPLTLVDDASLANGGVLASALTRYYDPIPPAPPGRTFRRYNGGNPQSAGSWGSANTTSNQYTNWDQALDDAQTPADLVVFITDGDPTAYDLDQPGDPFGGTVIGYNTSAGEAAAPTISQAIDEANLRRGGWAARARRRRRRSPRERRQPATPPAGVGSPGRPGRRSRRARQPQRRRRRARHRLEDLAAFLRSVVLQLCSPSLTIRKLAQTADDAGDVPAPGWDMTVTPTRRATCAPVPAAGRRRTR